MNWIQTTLVQMVWIQTGSEKSDQSGNSARTDFISSLANYPYPYYYLKK